MFDWVRSAGEAVLVGITILWALASLLLAVCAIFRREIALLTHAALVELQALAHREESLPSPREARLQALQLIAQGRAEHDESTLVKAYATIHSGECKKFEIRALAAAIGSWTGDAFTKRNGARAKKEFLLRIADVIQDRPAPSNAVAACGTPASPSLPADDHRDSLE